MDEGGVPFAIELHPPGLRVEFHRIKTSRGRDHASWASRLLRNIKHKFKEDDKYMKKAFVRCYSLGNSGIELIIGR